MECQKRFCKKGRKIKNSSHDALLEREHDSWHRMTEGGTHWLHDKNTIVLEMGGMYLCDYFLMENFFLDDNDFITIKWATMALPDFECENANQILYKKVYQKDKEQTAQFKPVAYLDEITGQNGKFINWLFLTLLGILQKYMKLVL